MTSRRRIRTASKAVAIKTKPEKAQSAKSGLLKIRWMPMLAGLIGIISLGIFAYVYFFAPIISPPPTSPSVKGVSTPAKTSQLENGLSSATPPSTISILIGPGSRCSLTLVQQPSGVGLPLTPSGWWKPGTCEDPLLIGVQIVRSNQSTILESAARISIASENIQLLDSIDTYAVIIRQQNTPVTYTLKRYLDPLITPIFVDREYFNPAQAQQQSIIGDYVYYLYGGCSYAMRQVPCSLWRWHQLTGIVELLEEYVAQGTQPGTLALTEGTRFKLAREQDYTDGVNVVRINRATSSVILIRIQAQLPQASVTSTVRLDAGDSNYARYVA